MAIMETVSSAEQRRVRSFMPIALVCSCLLPHLTASTALARDTPVAVRIVPDRVTLRGARAAQRFVVMATFADGLEREVTSQGRYSLSDPRLAAVDRACRVAALANGEVELKAELGKLLASARIRVEGSKEAAPFSFARDIGGILSQRGCNATDCHGSVKGQKGFKLSLNALYPREDYTWIVEGGVYQVLTGGEDLV